MSYGKRIFVGGQRPEWFRNKDAEKMIAITNWGEEQKPTDRNRNYDVDSWDWEVLDSIQLPADHEVYIALNAGLKPWRPEVRSYGPPADYIGGRAITRNGIEYTSINFSGPCWAAGINGDADNNAGFDIVGYEPVVNEAPAPDMHHTDTPDDLHKAISEMFDLDNKKQQGIPEGAITLSLDKTMNLFNIMLSHFHLANDKYPKLASMDNKDSLTQGLNDIIAKLKEVGLIQTPKPVDPDLVQARIIAAEVAGQGGNSRLAYENGERDHTFAVRCALQAIKQTAADGPVVS